MKTGFPGELRRPFGTFAISSIAVSLCDATVSIVKVRDMRPLETRAIAYIMSEAMWKRCRCLKGSLILLIGVIG